MTRDYVLDSVSMDNPQLVAYIRQVHLKPTTHQDPLNASQTLEERYVTSLSQGKREGVYAEYISRVRISPAFIPACDECDRRRHRALLYRKLHLFRDDNAISLYLTRALRTARSDLYHVRTDCAKNLDQVLEA